MTTRARATGPGRIGWAAVAVVAVLAAAAFFYFVATTPRSPQILNESTIEREIRPIGDGTDPRFVIPVFEEEEHPEEE